MHNRETQVKSHTIPADIIMDALRILLDNNITFQIEGINEHEHTVIVQTSISPKLSRHKKAMENLTTILSDYSYYRHGPMNENIDDNEMIRELRGN